MPERLKRHGCGAGGHGPEIADRVGWISLAHPEVFAGPLGVDVLDEFLAAHVVLAEQVRDFPGGIVADGLEHVALGTLAVEL